MLEKYTDLAVTYGIKIIIAAIILVVGIYIAKWLKKLVVKVMAKKDMDVAVTGFVSSLAYYALLAFVVITALSQVGVQTASFVAVLGAAGLAIGLALQGSLSNFAAGVLILIFKPFRLGDFVEIAGVQGSVSNIQVFTTELLTPDNKSVIVPNSQAMNGTITNYSSRDTRRIDLEVGIGYSDDIDKAKTVLNSIISDNPKVLPQPECTIAVLALADSSVNFAVRPWVKTSDYWDVFFELNETIKKRFDEENISIPFPQQDINIYHNSES